MPSQTDQLENWLTTLLHGLVTYPDQITIDRKTDEMGILFTIFTPDKRDAGNLIGKNGEHANAIRVLFRTHGHLHNVKASLKIVTEKEKKPFPSEQV